MLIGNKDSDGRFNNIYLFFLNKLHYGYRERFVECTYEAMLVDIVGKMEIYFFKIIEMFIDPSSLTGTF